MFNFFGEPKKENKEESPVETGQTGFDSKDIEANRFVNQIEKDAMVANSNAHFLLQRIDEVVNIAPKIFSMDMTLGDFDIALGTKKDDSNLAEMKQRLQDFIMLFPDDIKFNGSLEEFVKVLEAKRDESDQILFPKNYT